MAMARFVLSTGYRMNGWECFRWGFATHYVLSQDIPSLVHRLTEGKEEIEKVLDSLQTEGGI